MDNNKKIIVGVVAAVMATLLIVFMKMTFSSDTPNEGLQNTAQIAIPIPAVDEKEIEETSKKELYDKEDIDNITGENPFFDENQKVEEEKKELAQGFIIEGAKKKEEIVQKPVKSKRRKKRKQSSGQQMNDDLMMIMAMQEQIQEEQNKLEQERLQKQLEADYLNPNKDVETSGAYGSSSAKTANNSRFFGAVRNDENEAILDLIPAETVDKGIISQGSTVAIRTKRAFKIPQLGVTIPKNAVVYGQAQFSGANRMSIDIVSYKDRDKLYSLDLQVYDFDGREGVHLSNRTWTKIPAKVADDVYQYGYQKGTQQATFGNDNNTITLDETKRIAALSAAKEITDEILKKRKVMMPKKYNLWIHIGTEEGL